ncbi:tol-pal system YbgF family protein [Streptomyces sp. NPDC087300]|uniref:tetratricopeptide repeat protein n=1 Tax=Streptomyces sp. NPDC087300 TaxID=3365780 RepID=UPI0038229719
MPPPLSPPPLPPHPPTASRTTPHDPLHPLSVALLNLTGLGLGFVLLRRWFPALLCCAATAALLFIALPADVDGVPGGVLVGYVAFLLAAAVAGAHRATRVPGDRRLRGPVAVGLGVVLLAVPAGGAFAYEGARDEAVEQMLIGRLERADRIVAGLAGEPYDGAAVRKYGKALAVYRGLAEDHPGSKAADRLPDSLDAYYKTVAAPYAAKKYCDAISPLKHLRTVPDTLGKDDLGTLATWPDDRLATSLYECGTAGLGRAAADGPLGELLRTFPDSDRAARVEPALRAAIGAREAALKGSEPCPAVDELRAIGTTASGLPGGEVDAAGLRGAADRAVRRGVYACGIDEFQDDRFTDAARTMKDFAAKYPGDKKHDRADDIAVAAEIAAARPSAGRRLPPTRPGGGGTVDLVVANLGPGELELLYTGPTTGRVKLKDCASCRIFADKPQGDKACRAGVSTYPRTTLRLPAGEYHFLYKRATVRDRAEGARLSTAYRYTDCSFVTRGTAGLGLT